MENKKIRYSGSERHYSGSERRRFPRVSARIIYSKVKNDKYIGNETYTRDISVGGLCFISRESIDLKEELSLDIVLPTGELINVGAVVLRCDETNVSWDSKKHFKIAVSFTGLPDKASESIQNYLKRFSPEKN